MICTGCGQELPERGTRGRPARFHNAACRQRARRARLASRHHDVLSALAKLEGATSELRHVVLAGADPTEAARHLARASAAVHELLPDAAPPPTERTQTDPPTSPIAAPIPAPPVTESVTETNGDSTAEPPAPDRAPQPSPAPTPRSEQPAARPPRSVTKPITKRDRPTRVDPDTVRVERNPDDYGPTWRVLAGDADNPTLLGYVEAARTVSGNRSTNRWIATTRNLDHLNRRARNRTEAVAVLFDSYQRASGA